MEKKKTKLKLHLADYLNSSEFLENIITIRATFGISRAMLVIT